MTPNNDQLDLVAKYLEDHPEDESAIHRVWLGVESRSAPKPQRRVWAAAAAAAALLLALAGIFWPKPGPLALADGSSPVATDAVDGNTIRFDDGSELQLMAGARVVPTRNDREAIRFDLDRGRVRFSVQPGGPREWRVRTERVEVRVLGTQFVVDAQSSEVWVERGHVEVIDRLTGERRELEAGESWRAAEGEAGPILVEIEPVVDDYLLAVDDDLLAVEEAEVSELPANEAPRHAASEQAIGPSADWRASDGQYTAAFEALPDNEPISLSDRMLAVDIARHAGRVDEAVQRLTAILEDHPAGETTPLAALTLGRIERRRGRDAEAVRAFERARELGVPASFAAEVCAELALARHRLGEHQRARLQAAECVGTQPDSPFAALLRPLLRAE